MHKQITYYSFSVSQFFNIVTLPIGGSAVRHNSNNNSILQHAPCLMTKYKPDGKPDGNPDIFKLGNALLLLILEE